MKPKSIFFNFQVKLLLSAGAELTMDHFNSTVQRLELNLLQYLLNNFPLHPDSKISSIYHLIKSSAYGRCNPITSMRVSIKYSLSMSYHIH